MGEYFEETRNKIEEYVKKIRDRKWRPAATMTSYERGGKTIYIFHGRGEGLISMESALVMLTEQISNHPDLKKLI